MCWADVAPGMTATPTSSAQRSSTCALVAFAAAAMDGTLPRIRFFFSFRRSQRAMRNHGNVLRLAPLHQLVGRVGHPWVIFELVDGGSDARARLEEFDLLTVIIADADRANARCPLRVDERPPHLLALASRVFSGPVDEKRIDVLEPELSESVVDGALCVGVRFYCILVGTCVEL